MRIFDPITVPLRGTSLVEASAGTGKTFTITTLVVRLLLEEQLGIDQILIVTFTEAAAAELRERVRARLMEAATAYADPDAVDPQLSRLIKRRLEAGLRQADERRLLASVRAFDEAAISTIHGFCQRVLSDSALASGVPFDTELVVDDQPLLEEAVRDFWARELYGSDARFVRWLGDRRLTPQKLLSLARLAVSHVDAPVVPPRVELGKPPDVQAYLSAWQQARELFLASRHELAELLHGFGHFKKTTHSPDELAKILLALDGFFCEPDPGTVTAVPGMHKLTPEALDNGTLVKFKRSGGRPPEHPAFEALAQLVATAAPLRSDLESRELDLRVRLVKWLRKELPKRKAQQGVQSFDDLLQRLDGALRGRGGRELSRAIRDRYRAALIDEFQDTDPTQYRIFRAIYGGSDRPVLLIGDPKQAIYAFRGADVFAYIEAAEAAGERRFTMDRNWRSDPGLLAAVEHLFSVRRPFMLEDIGFVPVQPRPDAEPGLRVDGKALPGFEMLFQPREGTDVTYKQIRSDWADRHVPEVIAADISRLLASGATIETKHGPRLLHAGDVAVLVRKNAQAMLVSKALQALSIPSVVYGDASVFDTREAAELQRILGAIAEPTSSGRLRAAITTELLGTTADELVAMERPDDEADRAWADWVDDFRRWNHIWVERGFVQMFRALLSSRGVQQRTLAMLDGERRMTNLLHLAELLHTAAKAEHLGPSGLLAWLSRERARRGGHSEAVKLRLERDDRAVQLVTVHRSKGLEYPVVYCPWLWDGTLLFEDEEEFLLWHDPAQGHQVQLDVRVKGDRYARNKDPSIVAARRERAAENLRLLYVAVTRARHRCVAVWGPFFRHQYSALGYLLHSPELDERWPWDPAQIEAKIKESDDAKLERWLDERAGPTWTVKPMEVGTVVPYAGDGGPSPALSCRAPARKVDDEMRTTSFSGLASETQQRPVAAGESSDGRDHDEQAHTPLPLPADPDAPRVPLADFPRGAKAGNFVHAVLEQIDFTGPRDALEAVVADRLTAHGFSSEDWSAPVTDALAEVLRTPLLDGTPMSLADVPADRRLVELEFLLPLAGGAHATQARLAATREMITGLFARHAQGLPEGYPQRLSRLAFSPLRGFLKGFIDLCFVHEGRWYVVDYKTNFLGQTADDYTPQRLAEVMGHEHYVLQYHLYTVALVEHLRRYQPSFDYDRDFGGAAYLFVRGMSPTTGASRGVFFERPPRARIEGLTRLLRADDLGEGGER